MKPRTIRENVYLIGAVDWDRRLFDALIPLPDGTSYNAYLVAGSEKTALIDTVDPAQCADAHGAARRAAARSTTSSPSRRAGPLRAASRRVLERYPEATVVTNEKCQGDADRPPARRPTTASRSSRTATRCRLGDKTLTFIYTPWVHWPETMCTYLEEDRILFSCDFFGSHLATSDLFADEAAVYEAAKRYYAEIMMPFRAQSRKNLDKVTQYPIEIIAPSHGPVYDDPAFIIDAYRDWVGGAPQNIVCLPFVSMHDSTRHDGRPPRRGARRTAASRSSTSTSRRRHRQAGQLAGRRRAPS